jgi:hypothetical protein
MIAIFKYTFFISCEVLTFVEDIASSPARQMYGWTIGMAFACVFLCFLSKATLNVMIYEQIEYNSGVTLNSKTRTEMSSRSYVLLAKNLTKLPIASQQGSRKQT